MYPSICYIMYSYGLLIDNLIFLHKLLNIWALSNYLLYKAFVFVQEVL